MKIYLVVLVYTVAIGLAAALVWLRHTRWYWHILSIVTAFAIGLYEFPDAWRPPDLLVGFVFLLLFVWGVAEPLVHALYHHRVAPARPARL